MKTRNSLVAGLGGFLLVLLIALSGQSALGFNVTGKDLSENDTGLTEVTYTIDGQKFSNRLYATQPYLSTTHVFDAAIFLDKNGKLKVPDVNGEFNYKNWTFKPAKRGLEGSFRINDYDACVPDKSCGFFGNKATGVVGASVYVEYISGGDQDPTPTYTIIPLKQWQKGIHWLQFVEVKEGDGSSKVFIDVFPTSPLRYKQPYYDPVGRARLSFSEFYIKDAPSRPDPQNSHTWKAELYLVQETAPKTVTIYNGITWGWHNEKEKTDQISENTCKSENNQKSEECKQKQGISTGDPHLITFDGLRYDLQTVGEFILVKSNDGGFEVQARQTPLNSYVSLNSAVAMKVGSDRVAFYSKDFPDADTSTLIRVNGKPATIQGDKLKLPSGGEILRQGSIYVINSFTGEKVVINPSVAGDNTFFNVSSFVYNRSERYSGLLGNVNGKPNDDQQIRGGGDVLKVQSTYGDMNKVLNQVGLRLPGVLERGEKVYFDQLYKQFANSWRVKQEESLFDYPAGKTTESYVNPGFPNKYLTLNMLSPDQIQKARSSCTEAKVTQDLMEGCIFDVGFSGFSEFARATAEITGYVNIVNQLFPGLGIHKLGDIIKKPKICLPFMGCH